MPWTTLSDELMGEFRKATLPGGAKAGERYAGFIMGEAGAPKPVYSTVREENRGRTPGAGFYMRRPSFAAAGDTGRATEGDPAGAAESGVTASEVMYGARAANPRRDVGRAGSDTRSYQKYLSGRLEQENPPGEPPLNSMDRARLDMGFGGGMSVRGRQAFAAWDAATREASRRSGALSARAAMKDAEYQGRVASTDATRARLAMETDEFGWKREQRPQEMMKGSLEIAGKQVGLAGQIQEAELRQAQEGRAAEGNEYEKKNRWLKENETLQQMEIRHANELREHEKWQAEKQDRVKGMPVPETPEPGAAPGVAQGATPGTAAQPLPPIMVPADARKLPKGSRFRTPDGREMVVR